MKTQVTVFCCDWPGCPAQLIAPRFASPDAKRFTRDRGWLWTADDAEQHFCGTELGAARSGHARLVLDVHRPALIRLAPPWSGWFVGCWCGWSASEFLTVSAADTADEARARWADHLTPHPERVVGRGAAASGRAG
ncbi:hypothetical protein ACFWD7_28095 [Streptomyces mirabilis]|uniref:hypothetical protein n=1 Tax=Streptomyces mirabilis TaxID=68239 RepID=UPI003697D212